MVCYLDTPICPTIRLNQNLIPILPQCTMEVPSVEDRIEVTT